MQTSVLVLITTLAVVLAIASLWWLSDPARRRRALGDRVQGLNTLSWQPSLVPALDRVHRDIYHRLRAALPEHMILAQVPLSRFLQVGRRQSYLAWINKVGHDCAHFLVCNNSAEIVVAIEVRPSRLSAKAQRRRARVEKVLRQVELPVVVWDPKNLPPTDLMRSALLTMELSRRPEPTPSQITASAA